MSRQPGPSCERPIRVILVFEKIRLYWYWILTSIFQRILKIFSSLIRNGLTHTVSRGEIRTFFFNSLRLTLQRQKQQLDTHMHNSIPIIIFLVTS